VPISAIVIKSDTSSRKKLKVKKKNTLNAEKFECVFVKIGEEAKLRVITTGIQDDSSIEITSGLSEGDLVITGPYNTVTKTLNNGDKVEEKSLEEDKKDSEE
jgi:HlyD family secretion protein